MGKKQKSIAFDAEVYQRLELVCETIGVTPHSYIIQEIGKCVTRDYIQTFQLQSIARASEQSSSFFDKVENEIK